MTQDLRMEELHALLQNIYATMVSGELETYVREMVREKVEEELPQRVTWQVCLPLALL